MVIGDFEVIREDNCSPVIKKKAPSQHFAAGLLTFVAKLQ
jgi:hypothetical protein